MSTFYSVNDSPHETENSYCYDLRLRAHLFIVQFTFGGDAAAHPMVCCTYTGYRNEGPHSLVFGMKLDLVSVTF